MSGENGGALPAIRVDWDQVKHLPTVSFDRRDFRSWDFVIAVLEMAVQACKDQRQMAQVEGFRRQMQEQAQAQAIANRLQGPLIH